MGRIHWPLAVFFALLGCRASEPISEGEGSASDETSTTTPTVSSSSAAHGADSGSTSGVRTFDPWELWTEGLALRGANVYQQDEGRDDGESNEGFGPPLQPSDLVALRSAGANLVVFSVPGPYHVQTNDAWPQMQQHLDNMIDWAAEADLFVVIALRTGPGRGEGDITEDGLDDVSVYDDPAQRAAWVEMWTDVATRYRDDVHVVGYDLMVEPHDHSPQAWSSLAEEIAAGIRTTDLETPLLVSPGSWGGVDALLDFEPIDDPAGRTLYTVHQYEPFNFTHDGEALSAQEIDVALDDLYGSIEGWQQDYGAYVVVNEFGHDVSMASPNSMYFEERQLARLEDVTSGHAVWLWEVESDGYYAFDVRTDPEMRQLFEGVWARNSVYPSTL